MPPALPTPPAFVVEPRVTRRVNGRTTIRKTRGMLRPAPDTWRADSRRRHALGLSSRARTPIRPRAGQYAICPVNV
jgi:hypothetical protein